MQNVSNGGKNWPEPEWEVRVCVRLVLFVYPKSRKKTNEIVNFQRQTQTQTARTHARLRAGTFEALLHFYYDPWGRK